MTEHQKVVAPTLETVKSLAGKNRLNCSPEELNVVVEIAKGAADELNFVGTYKEDSSNELIGDRSYRKPEDNPFNAWYMKCSVKGDTSQGKLAGKKVAIKDNVAVAKIPMMNGSKWLEGYIPVVDATVVARILKEGGEIVGKTTCEDQCLSGVSFNTTYGPVRNPNNPQHSAGGSSSGSGAVVANNEVDMAIGGDQGGSIRTPASNCGIVGLKPTHGLVPYTGAVSICTTIDHLGPMAGTVADCALLLEVIEGFDDGADYRQNQFTPTYEYSKLIYPQKPLASPIRVAVLTEGISICDADVQETFNTAVTWLRSATGKLDISDISMPEHTDAGRYMMPRFYDGSSTLFEGASYRAGDAGFQMPSMVEFLQNSMQEKPSEIFILLKAFMVISNYVKDNHGTYFGSKASSVIVALRRLYDATLRDYDVIIMPTLNVKPCELPDTNTTLLEKADRSIAMGKNTAIFDGTGHPALSLNCGYVGDNLPIGLMVVGKHFDEVGVLNAAAVFEEILNEKLKKIEISNEGKCCLLDINFLTCS